MNGLRAVLEKRGWIAPTVVLAAFLVIGIVSSRDYGIAWDEPVQRQYGSEVYNFAVHRDQGLFLDRHRYYGPVFEMLLFSLEKGLHLDDSRAIYLMRHLVNFLVLWVGIVFFYKLVRYLLGNAWLALLACAMLFLSPRIFAHGFYNTKDIPFLTMFVIGFYTLLRFLDATTIWRGLAHGIACAVLVDTRIVGILLIALTVAALGYRVARSGRIGQAARKIGPPFGIFVLVWAGLTVLMWPTLWRDPVHNFVRVFEGMRNFPWEATVLYLGKYIWSTQIPWHYTLVWIAVSTPLAFVVMFLIGLPVSIAASVAPGHTPGLLRRRDLVLTLAWFFLPLASSIASRAVLYDEWRHSFFVYPALLIVGLVGIVWIRRWIEGTFRGAARKAIKWAVVVLVGANMVGVATFMIRYHPHENVFFNALTGGLGGANGKFEMDYWGLSYRQGLEYIVRTDPGNLIPVHAATAAGRYNADILKPADRKRLAFVGELADARYHVTTFRWDRERFTAGSEAFAIRVEGVPVMAVYRLPSP